MYPFRGKSLTIKSHAAPDYQIVRPRGFFLLGVGSSVGKYLGMLDGKLNWYQSDNT